MSRYFIPVFISILLFSLSLLGQSPKNETPYPSEVTLDHSRQFTMQSRVVGDQFLIKVYLPDSYFSNPEAIYPVIYLTDADRYFGIGADIVYSDFHREDIDLVLVGIGYGSRKLNNEKRRRDFSGENTVDGSPIGPRQFAAFLEEELFPRVESEFRLNSAKRALAGWSRGAVFVLDAMFHRPTLVQNYIALSPRLNYEDWSAIEFENDYSSKHQDLVANLFISMGSKDERHEQFPDFITRLNSRGYKSLQIQSEVFDGFEHDLFALTQGLISGLHHFFFLERIEYVLYSLMSEKGIEYATAEYHRLLKESPDAYLFREEGINELGYYLLKEERYSEAIEIFKLNIQTFPDSFNSFDSLAEAYLASGQNELAIKHYEKSLDLNPDNTNASKQISKIRRQNH